MIKISDEWNPKQALLNEYLRKPIKFDEAIKLCLELHSMVHTSKMSGLDSVTYEDELWEGLDEMTFRVRLKKRGATIAWNLWHLTRIEDIAANILITDGLQVMDRELQVKLNSTVLDTGNAMSDVEMDEFSKTINMRELKNYRIKVGRKTRKIIGRLNPDDLKRRMTAGQLKRILDEGGVLNAEGSRWLIDFWGRKTVAGLLSMPVTRHQVVHLNDSLKIKERFVKTSGK
jgi:hypothetical protein